MSEFELWVYRGLIALLLVVVWYFIKAGFSGIRQDIKELIAEVKLLNQKNASNDERFKNIIDRLDNTDDRLDEMQTNLKEIEKNQLTCKNRNF